MSSYRERLAAAASMQHAPNAIVSRILQLALGLFVSSSDMPTSPATGPYLSYDCSFDVECRWFSFGGNADRWKVAKGEPDSLLWLAATGTMQLPAEPFALIETKGQPVDSLVSDTIACQDGTSSLTFVYWAIGNADLEVCLADLSGHRFNCTGPLDSPVMPGKVVLKIPELQRPFRIVILPNTQPGVLIVDEIRYDAQHCDTVKTTRRREATTPPPPTTTAAPATPSYESTTTDVEIIKMTPAKKKKQSTIAVEAVPVTVPNVVRVVEQTTTVSTKRPIPAILALSTRTTTTTTTTTEATTTRTIPPTTTDVPFDLMIIGNKTSPMFDRRLGMIIGDSSKLLCDFKEDFPCQWGAEAGKWAIIQDGAIPSIKEDLGTHLTMPSFPAALVLQGTVMLTSDPVRCQTGPGKVLFRMWANGDMTIQVCTLGYGIDSTRIECFDRQEEDAARDSSLAVYEIPHTIKEAFTLNIVPQWSEGSRNKYLIIDEIAYIGECSPSSPPGVLSTTEPPTTTITTYPFHMTSAITTTESNTPEESESEETPEEKKDETTLSPLQPVTEAKAVKPTPKSSKKKTTRLFPVRTVTPPTKKVTTTEPEEEDFSSEEPFVATHRTTVRPFTTRYTNTPGLRLITTTPKPIDFCSLLNCNFDDNACNYLNHGLTKVPWTLRNRGYGYPLSGQTDVRPSHANGQFVSSLLTPGDIAILESPKFNLSTSLNVLLFQYYRPTQSSTIRLCLGSRYTTPLRTVASFARCPSILRAVTARNAFRWNTVHVQLPPGTTHFFLVAHNSERADGRTAIALDNMRVAICDPKSFAPEEVHQMFWRSQQPQKNDEFAEPSNQEFFER